MARPRPVQGQSRRIAMAQTNTVTWNRLKSASHCLPLEGRLVAASLRKLCAAYGNHGMEENEVFKRAEFL